MNWLPFEEARNFARSLNLRNAKDWNLIMKKEGRPVGIPSCPRAVYLKQGWKGWKDFLGVTSRWRSFKEARKYARGLRIRTIGEWREFCNAEYSVKPDDIPSTPNTVYLNDGWISWADFFGSSYKGSIVKYRTFKEARDYAHTLKVQSSREWRIFTKNKNFPSDVPKAPQSVYLDEGWISWADFLGTKNIAAIKKRYRPYYEAKDFVRALKLGNIKEWRTYCSGGFKNLPPRPSDIPKVPNIAYKNKGWVSWGDFLGTGFVAVFKRKFAPYKEALAFAKKYKIKTSKDWHRLYEQGKLPKNLPVLPNYTYKGQWKGWRKFAGEANKD